MKDDDFGLGESIKAYEKKIETVLAQYEELRKLAAHKFVGKWITRINNNEVEYLLVEKVSRCDYDLEWAWDGERAKLRKQDVIFKVDIRTELTPTSISHGQVTHMQLLNGRWKEVPESWVATRAREYASAIETEITKNMAIAADMQDLAGKL